MMLAFSYLDRELVVPLSELARRCGAAVAARQPVGTAAGVLGALPHDDLRAAWKTTWHDRPSLPEAARSLGVSGPRLFCKVYLPLLLPGTLSAALLVFIDVLGDARHLLIARLAGTPGGADF